MKKTDLILLIKTVYDLAKHGYEFSQKKDEELFIRYPIFNSFESIYAFKCGWLECDLRDIIKVIESTDLNKEFQLDVQKL